MPPFPQLREPLRSEAVALRPAADRDIPEVLIAHQDDPGMHLALGLRRPPSGAELGRRAEESAARLADGSEVWLTICKPGDDECRGQIEVEQVDWDHRRGALRVWVAPWERNRGVGAAALALASRWLLGPCGMERVEMLIEPGNASMLRAAVQGGFTDEGRLRSHLRARDRRIDVAVLSRVRGDLAP